VLIAAGLAAGAACTVHQTTAPSLTGPSEFSLSIGITAQPDSINQDGGSQSSIRVSAHDANGQAVAGQAFHLDVLVNGSQVDYGRLSVRTVVTGSDGNAFATYTAPSPLPVGATMGSCRTFNTPGSLAGQCVSVAATPIGTDFASSQTQAVEIRLTPVGVITAPVQTPTAQFTTSPASPTVNAPVIFDGSTSCPGALVTTGTGSSAVTTCNSNGRTITSYQWTFGDGESASGMSVSHAYQSAQSFSASLTVTNSDGGTATATKAVSVGGVANPTASFTVSPSPGSAGIAAGTTLNFNADGSSAVAGHRIVQFTWDFGDGSDPVTGGSTFAVQHKFTTASPGDGYVVQLTVVDDAGGKATAKQTIKVN
jgi:hypothetical protein